MRTEKMLWLLIFLVDSVLSQSGSSEPVTCTRPLPPDNTVIKTRECVGNCNYRVDTYREDDKVYFSCKMGYELAEDVPYYEMSVTCGRNGQWFPRIEKLKKCVPSECDSETQFRCKTSGKCLSKDKRCNCDFDCDDRSDEQDCPHHQKIIKTALKGSSGIISSLGYPRAKDYPKEYTCFYHIETLLPGHHIKLDFEEFNLPKKQNKKCKDSVRLMNVYPEFLRKRRKNPQMMLIESPPRSSQTKCGSNGFKSVYSNSTYIGINVTLGFTGLTNGYRGFSLSWEVKTRKDFYHALYKLRKKNKPSVTPVSRKRNDADEDDYTMATVILPIALCGILPLSFLAFYFCPRIVKPNCPSQKTKSTKDAVLLTLTENNLAKFDEQMGSVPHNSSCLLQPPEGHSSSANNENRFDIPVRKSVSQNKKLETESSQNSDLPRYVMSYDIPLTHLPTRQSSHSLHHLSSNSRGVRSNSSRSNKTSQNNSSINSMPQQSCNKVLTKSSRCRKYGDEHSNSSRINGIQSACTGSSRSTKTCSLCHQQRRTCNAVKTHQQTTQPHNDYCIQLVPTVHEMDDLDVYGQSSRHQYMKNTYPELDESGHSSEYIEIADGRDGFPYTDSSHTYPLPYKEKCNMDDYSDLYHEILPNLTYSDNEISDPTLTHLVEKRKFIYLEEICDTQERFLPVNNTDLYGTVNQAERRELKLNMYTLRV